MPATTAAAVKADVAAQLQVTAATLPAAWDTIVATSVEDAYNELITLLIMKGYSATVALSASQFEVWQRRLATYFALGRGASYASFDVKTVEWLDPREKLEAASAIVVDGVATAPEVGESDVGGISSGQMDAVVAAQRWCDGFGGRRNRYGC